MKNNMCIFIVFLFINQIYANDQIYADNKIIVSEKTIQGTAPYLKFNDKKIDNSEELVTFIAKKEDDSPIIYDFNDGSTKNSPIVLPTNVQKFSDLITVIPSNNAIENGVYKFSLSNYIANEKNVGDDDGDHINGVSGSGDLTLQIKNKYNEVVNLNDKIDVCNAPYTLMLSASDLELKTIYGDPNLTNYNTTTKTYYITKDEPTIKVCLARPANFREGYGFRPEWIRMQGYRVMGQTVNNFPKTGFDKATFEIITNHDLTAEPVALQTSGENKNVTLTAKLANNDKKTITLTLTGPNKTNKLPFKPAEFAVYSDASKTNKLYSFKLTKWFINSIKENINESYDDALSFCENLPDYRIPKVRELTNAHAQTVGFASQYPNFILNIYHREIGQGDTDIPKIGFIDQDEWSLGESNNVKYTGGLIAEWGRLSAYPDSNLGSSHKWTTDVFANKLVIVDSNMGTIKSENDLAENRDAVNTMCVSDGNAVIKMLRATSIKPLNTSGESNQPEWLGAKGFRVKSKFDSSVNFPTTGFNQASFDINTNLNIIGTPFVEYSTNNSNVVVNAAVQNNNKKVINITLSGPSHWVKKEFKPTEFTIYSDNNKTNKIYSFKITKWFVGKSTLELYKDAERYCDRLPNYRMAELKEITNAHDPDKGFPSNTPGWTKPSPARMIGDGTSNGALLAEWGDIKDYDYAFSFINYAWSKGNPYTKVYLSSKEGLVNDRRNNAVASYMCVSK